MSEEGRPRRGSSQGRGNRSGRASSGSRGQGARPSDRGISSAANGDRSGAAGREGRTGSGQGRSARTPQARRPRRDPAAAGTPPPARRAPTTPRPPGLERRADEPSLPPDLDTRELHRSVRAELRGLPKELAETVAGHLLLAGQLVDSDPELAFRHAEAARHRAARLPIVREAAAETAYAAGHFDTALSEYRALRRMTGTADYLPVMADCERALGRPQAALRLAKESTRYPLDPAMQTEMTIVEAGARCDLGQDAEALRLLARAVAGLRPGGEPTRMAQVRLRYAYAEALLRAGEEGAAREQFSAAAAADRDDETDATERVDALDGLVIDLDEDDPDIQTPTPVPGPEARDA
ncbi:MAG: hypothetical protein ACLGIF_00775 [Actinomycetes bacterium]